MKILVLSDSHGGLSFMRRCIRALKPDAMVHLGDLYEDGEVMAEENPHIRAHLVPGNCDRHRMVRYEPTVRCYPVCGVKVYMTHGHEHFVKTTLVRLLSDARALQAQVVLYGHTHAADCHQEADGLWVLNPGSCSSSGGSVGLIQVLDNHVISCQILHHTDLEKIERF